MSVYFAPIANGAQFFDTNGAPLNAGFIYTYAAGSTTPTATYTTYLGNVQNANPIVLGADGRPPQEIWLTGGTAYKFLLTDSLLNTIATYDNLYGIGDPAAPNAGQFLPLAGGNMTGGANAAITTVASATSPTIFATTIANTISYTGTATCTGFTAAPQAGATRTLVCTGAAVFTAGANMLIAGVSSGSNYTAAANDEILVTAVTTTQFLLVPLRYSGVPVGAGPITNALSGNVSLAVQSQYYDGPTCAQGTVGTWFASGHISVTDSGGLANIDAKLWDGTTVIASARGTICAANATVVIHLSGFISSPAGNIKITAQNITSNLGTIVFNSSGNSKDSTLTVFRIA